MGLIQSLIYKHKHYIFFFLVTPQPGPDFEGGASDSEKQYFKDFTYTDSTYITWRAGEFNKEKEVGPVWGHDL